MTMESHSDYKETINLLAVDDIPANLFSLEKVLEDVDINFIKAGSGQEALSCLLKHDIALILLDVHMPGMDGYETARLIQENHATQYIPIIFVTAHHTEKKHMFEGYRLGAVDYIFKPVDPAILKGKVSVFLELHRQKRIIEAQNEELNTANRRIIRQQNEIIEEERIKIILQMAGAAAHELNQPLAILLDSIDMLELDSSDPEKMRSHTANIQCAGGQIFQITRRIQSLGHDNQLTGKADGTLFSLDNEISILSVDDNDDDYNFLISLLTEEALVKISREKSVHSALHTLGHQSYDIIFVELTLPDGSGLDILKILQQKSDLTPVIFLTDQGNEAAASNVIREGAHDYLAKSDINHTTVTRIIKNAIEKRQLHSDIDKAMKKIVAMSTTDELTGIYNRRYMKEVLEQEFIRAKRYGADISCLLLDLDFFKDVNDTYGHDGGDLVLREFAQSLKLHTRSSDYVFRYGGEEFLILMPNTDIAGATRAAEIIRLHCQNTTHSFNDQSILVTTSIGISSLMSCSPSTGPNLISFADKALYQAKADGRNCVRVFQVKAREPLFDKATFDAKGIDYLKEKLASILENTKTSSMRSLELFIKDFGDDTIEQEVGQTVRYIHLFGEKLGLSHSHIQALARAASLHGYFKILLGEEILMKQSVLSQKERQLVEQLPVMQLELAEIFDFFANEKSALLYNNERFDGKGYPTGLSAHDIPLGARILAISSAVTAMMSTRPYRKKLIPEEVLSELVSGAGNQFDPDLVSHFLDIIADHDLIDIAKSDIAKAKNSLQ